jgi:hypothetical protein
MSDSRRGFGLDIGFIDHFNTRLVITRHYSVIADLHTLQNTRAHRLALSVCYSLNQTSPGNGSNNGYFSASGLKSFLNGGSLPTAYSCSSCPPYDPSARTTVENPISNGKSIFGCGLLLWEPIFATVA